MAVGLGLRPRLVGTQQMEDEMTERQQTHYVGDDCEGGHMTIEERAERLRVGHCKVCEGCPGAVRRLLSGENPGGRHSSDPCNCITRTTIYAQRDNPTETALDALALAYDVITPTTHPVWYGAIREELVDLYAIVAAKDGGG